MKNRQSLKLFSTCLVVASMILGLCACGEKSETSANETTGSTPSVSSVASDSAAPATSSDSLPQKEEILKDSPEEYLHAVVISINPSFMAYINERNEIFRLDALNDDAKSLLGEIVWEGRTIRDSLKDIVRSSIDHGFLKDNGTVNISMLDSRATSGDAEQMLAELEQSVSEVAQERELHIAAATNVEPDIQFVVDRGDQPDPNQGDPNPPPPDNQGDPNTPSPDDQGDPNAPDHPSDPNQADPGNNQGNPDDPQPTDGDPGNPDDPSQNPGGNDQKVEGCPVCQGSGKCTRCDLTGVVECVNCHGAGKVPCHLGDCDNGYQPCPCDNGNCHKCGGTGVADNGQSCDACGGSGNHKECGGTGKVTCFNCNGTGLEVCSICDGTGTEECQGCHGTLVCEACDGTGLNLHKQN